MKHNNSFKLQENVNSAIIHIEKWMEAKKLFVINYTKFEYMIITNKKLKHKFEIKIINYMLDRNWLCQISQSAYRQKFNLETTNSSY